MLLSSKQLLQKLEERYQVESNSNDNEGEFRAASNSGVRACILDVHKLVETQGVLTSPYVAISQIEKSVTLYCDDELYKFITDMEQRKGDDLNIVSMGKLYVQLKKILDKGIQRDTKSTTTGAKENGKEN